MELRETLITAPDSSVISLWRAKAQCSVTHSEFDDLLTGYALAADARCEDVTGRQLLTATWEAWSDGWPACRSMVLPRPNLQSVTSVSYLDTAGALQVLDSSDYVVEAFAGPRGGFGRISLAYGASWPSVLPQAKAVRIRYVAGYGDDGADVPASIQQGLLLTIATWFATREDATEATMSPVPLSARRLWRPFYVR